MGATGEVTVEVAGGRVWVEAVLGGLNAPDWEDGTEEFAISK